MPGDIAEHSTRWGVPLPVEDIVCPTAHPATRIEIVNDLIRPTGRGSDIVGRFGRAGDF